MRILHVISGLGVGGAERNMARLVRHLRGNGHDCWVLSASGLGPVADELGHAPTLACELPRSGLHGWRRARAFAGALRPDLIHGWMYHGNLLAALLAGRRQAPLLWDIRHSIARLADEKTTTRWAIRASGWPLWRPGLVVFNSEAGRHSHEALGYPRWPSEVIPNGVETDRYAGGNRVDARARLELSTDGNLVAWIARDHPMKDLKTFAAAAARIAANRSDARFVFAGRGMTPSNARVMATLESHHLADRSVLLGERNDLPDLYPAFDLVMSSSRFGEGTPNVLLEGMAAGVPCVSTDVGDAGRVLGDPRWLVPPGTPVALADAALAALALTPSERDALIESNRERIASEYSTQRCFDAYQSAYERLTARV